MHVLAGLVHVLRASLFRASLALTISMSKHDYFRDLIFVSIFAADILYIYSLSTEMITGVNKKY